MPVGDAEATPRWCLAIARRLLRHSRDPKQPAPLQIQRPRWAVRCHPTAVRKQPHPATDTFTEPSDQHPTAVSRQPQTAVGPGELEHFLGGGKSEREREREEREIGRACEADLVSECLLG